MGLGKKALVGLMAISLAGAIGGAFALTRNAAYGNATNPAFDQAIYLYWDTESATSATLTDIPSVQVNTPVYRKLVVSPKSTKSVSGTINLTFTLSALTNKVITGLTVAVYDTGSTDVDLTSSEAIAANCIDEGNGHTLQTTLSSSHTSDTVSFTISNTTSGQNPTNEIHTTVRNYVLKINYDGTADANDTLGGRVEIAQDFAA